MQQTIGWYTHHSCLHVLLSLSRSLTNLLRYRVTCLSISKAYGIALANGLPGTPLCRYKASPILVLKNKLQALHAHVQSQTILSNLGSQQGQGSCHEGRASEHLRVQKATVADLHE